MNANKALQCIEMDRKIERVLKMERGPEMPHCAPFMTVNCPLWMKRVSHKVLKNLLGNVEVCF